MMALDIVVPIVCYLFGSVPTAYLIARWGRGVDIRKRGSGQVGGTNVWHSVSRRIGAIVVIADVAKGVIVVLLTRVFGLGIEWQVVAALAAIIGHNWSVFLRFGGGRGLATLGGALLVLAPREALVFVVLVGAGLLLRAVPVSMLIGVASVPFSAWLFGESHWLVFGSVMMLLIVAVKRIVPRKKWPSEGRGRVLLYRLLFDRDIRNREDWINGNMFGDSYGHRAAASGGAVTGAKNTDNHAV
jgi:acyl phosphate:glycerol-3-phosphate acyltransferase